MRDFPPLGGQRRKRASLGNTSEKRVNFSQISCPYFSKKLSRFSRLVVKPLVDALFVYLKRTKQEISTKTKLSDAYGYMLNQEKYLCVFLADGEVPIDNNASERAIRGFCIGKKNWMFHNTANGANASALVYSISETAKLNNLRPYYYFKYILTELPKRCDKQGNIDPAELDDLMPWSSELPDECRKPRRS